MGGLATAGRWLLGAAGVLKNVVIGGAGVLGTGVAVDTVAGTGITQNFMSKLWGNIGRAQTDAGMESGWFGINKIIDLIAKFMESLGVDEKFTAGIRSWANDNMGTTPDGTAPTDTYDGDAPTGTDIPTRNASVTPGDIATIDTRGDIIGGISGFAAGAFNMATHGGLQAFGKSIPIVGGVIAAVDGAIDAGGYALKGDWEKAGVRTVSAVADTALSALGGPVGFAFGAAAREGIESAGEAMLGENARVPDGELVGMTKSAATWVLDNTHP